MTERDPYLILNVTRHAAARQITSSYRKLARIYHPDINERSNADARMQEINWAYEILGDPAKKAEYDRLHPPPPTLEQRRSYAQTWSRDRFVEDRERWKRVRARKGRPGASSNLLDRWPHENSFAFPFLRGGVDGAIIGVLVALVVLLITLLAGGELMVWGGVIALVVGCLVAADADPRVSGQNGSAVGGVVAFLYTAAAWTTSSGGLDGGTFVGLFVCSGVTTAVLGIPIGTVLGRFASWTKR